MPNDPTLFSQKVVGLWIFGLDDIRHPYVWSACARFVFCTNFKDGGGGKLHLDAKKENFLVIVIDHKHRTQFFEIKVN